LNCVALGSGCSRFNGSRFEMDAGDAFFEKTHFGGRVVAIPS
jgi:hypothetical protein